MPAAGFLASVSKFQRLDGSTPTLPSLLIQPFNSAFRSSRLSFLLRPITAATAVDVDPSVVPSMTREPPLR
ncbi:hypothetical protein D3C72_2363050 [compost metagenome]